MDNHSGKEKVTSLVLTDHFSPEPAVFCCPVATAGKFSLQSRILYTCDEPCWLEKIQRYLSIIKQDKGADRQH